MSKFIPKVVDELLQSNANFGNTTLVVPNFRIIVFFKSEFAKISYSGILPKFVTMDDLMFRISGYSQTNNLSLKIVFFNFFKKINPNESFSEFCQWFPSLINDFNDIKINCIDEKALFGYLRSAERISNWSLDANFPKNIINKEFLFWEKAEKLFILFEQWSKENKTSYKGDVYNIASKKSSSFFKNSNENWIFCGLNILSQSEQIVIDHAKEFCKTEFFFDADKFFLDNPSHEAGKYQRILIEKYSDQNPKWVFDYFSKPKSVTHYKANNNQEQAKLVGDLLNQIPEEEWNETLVNLVDETCLESLLFSLPKSKIGINISMGFPLAKQKWFDFFDALLQTVHSIQKTISIEKAKIIELNNLFQNLVFVDSFNPFKSQKLSDLPFFVNKNELEEFFNPIFWTDFLENSSHPIHWLEKLRQWILDQSKKIKQEKNKIFLASHYQIFGELQQTLLEYKDFQNFDDIQVLYKSLCAENQISFVGDSQSGIQIMGMLESRLLSYKNVIITSVNESFLPAKSENSLIPFEVRLHFSLPTFLDNEATTAYYFYRLIQWADDVKLVSINQKEEESRYIKQLKLETQHKVEKVLVGTSVELTTHPKIEFIKSDFVKKKLEEWLQKGVSTSALGTYQKNPFDFYKRYVLGLKDEKLPENTIGPRELGNAVHWVLEQIYTPFLGRNLDLKMLKQAKEIAQSIISQAFSILNPPIKPDLLSQEAALQMVYQAIKIDEELLMKNQNLQILFLEEDYSRPIKIGSYELNLVGKIDRIHKIDDKYFAVDYKTGKLEISDLKWDKEEHLMKKAKIYQLMIYHYLLSDEFHCQDITTQIYSLQSKKYKKPLFIEGNFAQKSYSKKEIESQLQILSNLLDEIFDENINFEKIFID